MTTPTAPDLSALLAAAVETAARANAETARTAVMDVMGWEDDRNSGDRPEFQGVCWRLAGEVVQAVADAFAARPPSGGSTAGDADAE